MRFIATVLVSAVTITALSAPAIAADDPTLGTVKRPGTKAPAVVSGLSEKAKGGDRGKAALAHLAERSDRYHVKTADLRVSETVTRGKAGTVRLAQSHRGVPVLGGEYLVHFDGDTVVGAGGRFYTELTVGTQATIDAQRAEERAIANLKDPAVRKEATATSRGLVVLPQGTGVLAQHVSLSGTDVRTGLPLRREVYVEATSGVVLLDYDNLQHIEPADGTGTGSRGETLPLKLSRGGDGTYELRDQSRAMWNGSTGEILTYDADGYPVQGLGSALQPDGVSVATSPTTAVGGGLTERGVVDAHWGAGEVYEFFRSRFGREGIDGEGGTMVSVAGASDMGAPFVNAYWDGQKMVYGTGDAEYLPLSSELDVVGHEMTHGVIERTAGLLYLNQSGAMNEAIADYVGNAIDVERSGTSMKSKSAGLLGEDLCRTLDEAACALRDLGDGRRTEQDYLGVTVHTDNGGVHLNSTIFSGALWDIRKSLPDDLADRVVYTALSEFMTPLDTFVDGRNAVLAAAEALGLGRADRVHISKAFENHGISAGWENRVPRDSTLLAENLTFTMNEPQAAGGWWTTADTANDGSPTAVWAGRVDGSGRTRISPDDGLWHVFPTTDGKRVYWVAAGSGWNRLVSRPIEGGETTEHYRTAWSDISDIVVDEDGTIAWYETRGGIFSDIWYQRPGGYPINADPAYGTISFAPSLEKGTLAFGVHGGGPGGYGYRVGTLDLATDTSHRTPVLTGVDGYEPILGNVAVSNGTIYWGQDTVDDGGSVSIMRSNPAFTEVKPLIAEDSDAAPRWTDIDAVDGWVTYLTNPSATIRTSADLPKLYQVRGDGSSAPVRVSCSPGSQVDPASDRGQGVVWLDGSRSTTDLVARSTPAGDC